jgi:transposase, IS5 family
LWQRPSSAIPSRKRKPSRKDHIPDAWKDKPAKIAQKDRDARWTVKYSKAKPREDGSLPPVDLAIPAFGYKRSGLRAHSQMDHDRRRGA